ncbi:MAG: nuclease-related domain-containing protein [Bacilli bacterium]|jgi:hypothetical protein
MNGTLVFVLLMVVLGLGSLCFIFQDVLTAYWVGWMRQRRFRFRLRRFVRMHDFLYLNNLTLRVDSGRYLPVDHLIFGDHLVYVIMVKFWYGLISGSTEDEKWILTDGQVVEYVDNPARANELRIGLLSRILGIDRENFVSVVVIAKSAAIDQMTAAIPHWHVLNEGELIPFLLLQEKTAALPPYRSEELEKMADRIYDYHQKSIAERNQKLQRSKVRK